MLSLCRKSRLMRFARSRFFRRGRTGSNSAFPAVKGNVRFVVHHHRAVDVNVGDVNGVDMHHRGVVEESSTAPFAANKADAAVAEAVVNTTVETDVRTPVACMPRIEAAAPSPIAGRPQHADGSHHPGARHPVVASIIVPGPVAGRPQIAGTGTNGLGVNWQRG